MTVPLVGYGSAGWRYSIVGWNGGAGFESPSFNDATWASGTGGFGDGGCGLPANTPWGLNSDLLVRRWVTVPMNGRIRVAAKIDNDVQAFVNGIALSSLTVFEGCGGSERYASVSPPLAGGPTLIAVRARDRGGHSYFDARIEIVFEGDCNGDGIVDYGQILDGTYQDMNSNSIPDVCECPADLDQSGSIDAEDLAYVLFAWGTDGGKTAEADIDRSGTVDANDLSIVLGSWGPCP